MNDEFLELKEEIYSRLDIGTEISDEQLLFHNNLGL